MVTWGNVDMEAEDYEMEVRIAEVKFAPDLVFDCKNIKYPHVYRFGSFAYQNTERYLKVIGNIYEN
jgi:hypothetical protein